MTGRVTGRATPDWAAAEEAARAAAFAPDGPGGVVLGFDASGERFAVASGRANLATGAEVTADTVMRYASLTKHVFASMLLSNPGVVRLDDPLGTILAELPAGPGAVTFGQALSMTGGLPDTRETLVLAGLSESSMTDAGPLLAFHAGIGALNYPAGSEVLYSNAGYRLAEAALARRGLRFADHVAMLNDRLGTGFHAPEHWADVVPGLEPGHVRGPDGWRLGGQGMHLSAAGSLNGSARMLARWLGALMAGEPGFEGLLAQLCAPRSLADGRGCDYMLGLVRRQIGGRGFVGHGGSQAGYRAFFLLDPEGGSGVVVLTNRDDGDATGLAERVTAALHGLDLPPPLAPDWAPPGIYAAAEGSLWAELRPGSIVIRSHEERLCAEGDLAVGRAGQQPIRLARAGADLVGEIGGRACRLSPVRPVPAVSELDGRWEIPAIGARFEIRTGRLLWGIGPLRQQVPLAALGSGRYLAALSDGLGSRRVCLARSGPDRLTLSTNRSRVLTYTRTGG